MALWLVSIYFSLQHLRVLRHPSILHFHELVESSEGRLIITEEVRPLTIVLPTLTSLEVLAGLHELLQAMIFLHDTVSSSIYRVIQKG